MAEAFFGQIRMFGFGDAPEGWAKCDGTSIPISQNRTLYDLIGKTYGGDENNFNLPDLRGRVPVGAGSVEGSNFSQTVTLGEVSGSETRTLTLEEMHPHKHRVMITAQPATSRNPTSNILAESSQRGVYRIEQDATPVAMSSMAVSESCQGQPFDNMQRSIVFNFCIVLNGFFPA